MITKYFFEKSISDVSHHLQLTVFGAVGVVLQLAPRPAMEQSQEQGSSQWRKNMEELVLARVQMLRIVVPKIVSNRLSKDIQLYSYHSMLSAI